LTSKKYLAIAIRLPCTPQDWQRKCPAIDAATQMDAATSTAQPRLPEKPLILRSHCRRNATGGCGKCRVLPVVVPNRNSRTKDTGDPMNKQVFVVVVSF